MKRKDGAEFWLDSYGNKYRVALPEKSPPVDLPAEQAEFIASIKQKAGKRGGCWDVFVWKDDEIKFVVSKRSKKDELRENQILWLETALKMGIAPDSFLLVEWTCAQSEVRSQKTPSAPPAMPPVALPG